jgi:hypothetical protein
MNIFIHQLKYISNGLGISDSSNLSISKGLSIGTGNGLFFFTK